MSTENLELIILYLILMETSDHCLVLKSKMLAAKCIFAAKFEVTHKKKEEKLAHVLQLVSIFKLTRKSLCILIMNIAFNDIP